MYFIPKFITQYSSVYFLVQIVSASAIGSSLSWLWCLFVIPPSGGFRLSVCWSASLRPGTTRCSRLILYISCPGPRISQFSGDPWFFSINGRIRNQDLGAKCTCCSWGVLASRHLSRQRRCRYASISVSFFKYKCVTNCIYIRLDRS